MGTAIGNLIGKGKGTKMLLVSKISKRLIWTAGLALLWTCLAGLPLFGQGFYGTIRGLVTDPNGGVVAGAKITLINEGTSEQRTTNTSGSGEYNFPDVVPGTYSVNSEAPGFKKFERKGIIVATQASVTADAKLEVGQVSESVQVTEVTPLIESSNASQGQELDNQKLSRPSQSRPQPVHDVQAVKQHRSGWSSRLQSHGRSKRIFDDLHCRWPGSR